MPYGYNNFSQIRVFHHPHLSIFGLTLYLRLCSPKPISSMCTQNISTFTTTLFNMSLKKTRLSFHSFLAKLILRTPSPRLFHACVIMSSGWDSQAPTWLSKYQQTNNRIRLTHPTRALFNLGFPLFFSAPLWYHKNCTMLCLMFVLTTNLVSHQVRCTSVLLIHFPHMSKLWTFVLLTHLMVAVMT